MSASCASIGDLIKYREDWNYNALGASGAVSAILFASILFAPLYLLYCWYMAKRNMDNIGHTAHFWGAVYGLLFPLVFNPGILRICLSQFGF